jgi:phosphoglycerol transferase
VIALIGASFALCHAPAVVYPLLHGANDVVGARAPAETELFALTLAHMVIPRPEHRLERLAIRGRAYDVSSPLPRGEGFTASIGSVATVGLAIALVVLLATGLGAAASVRRRRIAAAGAAALVAFLIGTTGGGSTLIAYELSAQVRAWNRLSLVIAFAALLTIALGLTALGDRLRARGRPRWILGVLAAVVGVVGILDQTAPTDAPNYAAIGAAWRADEDFVSAMQARFPADTKVVQLPYMSYPEHGPVNGLADYDLFKGYLHSEDLRWSYGAIRGRPADWLAQHELLAPERLATAAAAAGFGAVYLDRAGYADGGAAAAAALETLTGPGNSAFSADRRLQFFDLRPAAERLADLTGRSERAQLKAALLRPVRLGFGAGFAKVISGETGFRWAGSDARLTLDNPRGRLSARFVAQLFGGAATPSAVTITLPGGARRSFSVTDQGLPVSLPMAVEPGAATVRVQTDGPPAPNPAGVDRDLRLRIAGARIELPVLQRARYAAAATP